MTSPLITSARGDAKKLIWAVVTSRFVEADYTKILYQLAGKDIELKKEKKYIFEKCKWISSGICTAHINLH